MGTLGIGPISAGQGTPNLRCIEAGPEQAAPACRAPAWNAVVTAIDGLGGAEQEIFVAYHVIGDALYAIADRNERSPLAIEQMLIAARQAIRRALGPTEDWHDIAC
jgi:hypothetical protein